MEKNTQANTATQGTQVVTAAELKRQLAQLQEQEKAAKEAAKAAKEAMKQIKEKEKEEAAKVEKLAFADPKTEVVINLRFTNSSYFEGSQYRTLKEEKLVKLVLAEFLKSI